MRKPSCLLREWERKEEHESTRWNPEMSKNQRCRGKERVVPHCSGLRHEDRTEGEGIYHRLTRKFSSTTQYRSRQSTVPEA